MPRGDTRDCFEVAPADLAEPEAPFADRVRPRALDDVVGQEHLLGANAPLRALIEAGQLPSVILWGPPGSGKTTIARLMVSATHAGTPGDAEPPRGETRFVPLSAVLAGVKDLREVVAEARRGRDLGRRTVVFIDEIHRWSRAQQDALLPHVEAGTVTLIGATTENPSFEVTAPLLSRCRVFTLRPLSPDQLATVLRRALEEPERGLRPAGLRVPDEALEAIAHAADGDARRALGILEAAATLHRRGRREGPLDPELVRKAAGRRVLLHDRDREEHYNVVSALIKSLRASDPDAALYYLARMLGAGEDPLFVARRLVIFASEDVGNAEPAALPLATSAFLAAERIGMPEARIPLAQAVTFLACAPKSNASYKALGRAAEALERHGSAPIPLHLRNAPTGLLRELGYGRDYLYPHDQPGGFVSDRNLPEAVGDAKFYEPTREGAERVIAERLADWRTRRRRDSDTSK